MIERITDALSNEYLKYNDGDWNSAIDRAIQIVQEVAKENGKDTNVRSKEYEKGYEDGYEDGAESVRALAPYEDGWIPCSERLPEKQDEYLVFWTAEGYKEKCFYEIIEYHLEDGWIGEIHQAPFGKYTVIAWQPLPPKYEKKGE